MKNKKTQKAVEIIEILLVSTITLPVCPICTTHDVIVGIAEVLSREDEKNNQSKTLLSSRTRH